MSAPSLDRDRLQARTRRTAAARRGSPAYVATTKLEQAEVLDVVGAPLAQAVRDALPAGTTKDLLSGTWLGHALHPLLTDIPIGTWTSSVLLDLVGGKDSQKGADLLLGAGIASAIPAAATGMSDWGDTQPKEQRVGLVHAATNTVALGLFTASLVTRAKGNRARGKLLSLAGAGVLGAGGYLGGHLSYSRGLGVDSTAFEAFPDQWTDAGTEEADVREGELTHGVANGVDLVLTRVDGELLALADRCVHRGAPLHEGELCDGILTCPWHQSAFRVEDGSVQTGPAVSPQPVFDVRVRAGRIEVLAEPLRQA